MRINFYAASSLLQAIFAELEEARADRRLPKAIDVTKAEYASLLKETGLEALTSAFGFPVTVEGEEVANPMELLLAGLEKQAAETASPNNIN